MKKLLCIALSMAASASMLMMPAGASAASAKTWHFGGADYATISGQDGSAQGQNGWYYMWSPQTNAKGKLDAGKIEQDVASETGSSFFAWGTGYVVDGTKGWVPSIYAADGYDAFSSNNWWLQMPDGRMNPAVVDGTKATAVLGWKAPEDGFYTFSFNYTAGDANTGASNDGLTVSVNTATGVLYSKATSTDKTDTESTTVTANLKSGEYIYFAADPNATGDNDSATFEVGVTKSGNYVDNKTSFRFGPDYSGQDGSAQGQNGWYYMWSSTTNASGSFDASTIKEDVASETGSSFFAWGTGYVVDGSKGWVPSTYAADGYDAFSNNNWWLQMPDGRMNPAVVEGPKASAVLGWKAPKDGVYSVDFAYTAGNANEGDNNDGLTISVNTASSKLYSKATSKDKLDTESTAITNVTLKKGDYLYFIADPNATGDNDAATFTAEVTMTKALSSNTTSETTSSESTSSESTSSQSSSSGTTENPKTGSSGVDGFVVVPLLLLASFGIVALKKR